jgi:hypothetical protein
VRTRLTQALLATLAAPLALLDAYGLLLLRRHGATARLVAVQELDNIATRPGRPIDALRITGATVPDHLGLLRTVMDSVREVAPEPSASAEQLYALAQQGHGLLCSGMATLYFAALTSNGVRARVVELSRDLFDAFDSHVTVEVWHEGRWVIFDPTFHVSFERSGQLLGAQEIADSLLDGSAAAITPVFHGDVRYPSRLETYYMHWLPLFNNTFVRNDSSSGLLARLPPWRYWYGPRLFFRQGPQNTHDNLRFYNRLYRLFVGVLPTVLGLDIAGLIALEVIQRRKKT